MVLEGLSTALFEPIESDSEKYLTLKTESSFWLSQKRIVDLLALSVSPSCLEFAL